MTRVTRAIRSIAGRYLPRSSFYEGSGGTVWFAGHAPRGSSIAAHFSGDDATPGANGRIWRGRIPDQVLATASSGGLAVVSVSNPDLLLSESMHRAVAVPAMVDMHTNLPTDVETLRDQLRTSTTKEDFRRIRKADFTYRVSSDPDAIREFHTRHYTPLVERQYPEDGTIRSVEGMLEGLELGAEVVCADIDGEWVAGIYNTARDEVYSLQDLGIRDADDDVRNKRVVAALIVRSLERAVELGYDQATLGRSLPFLGKGSVWFKAKWGGIATRDPRTRDLHMFMDLRHEPVRRMLSSSPVIHTEGHSLVTSKWLEPGEKALRATVRDAGRFPGISRWYIFAEPETLETAGAELSGGDRTVPVPVPLNGKDPLWLGETLPDIAPPG